MRILPKALAALSLPVIAAAAAIMAPTANAGMFDLLNMHDGPQPGPTKYYNGPGDAYRYEFKAKSQAAVQKYKDIKQAYKDGYVPMAFGIPGHPSLHLINLKYMMDFRTFDVNRPEVLVYYQATPLSKPEGLISSMFFGATGLPVAKFPGSHDYMNTLVYFHVYYMCDLEQAYKLHPNWMIHYMQSDSDCSSTPTTPTTPTTPPTKPTTPTTPTTPSTPPTKGDSSSSSSSSSSSGDSSSPTTSTVVPGK